MYFAVMHFANGSSKHGIVTSVRHVMVLDAQDAGGYSQSQAFAFVLPRFAACSVDWPRIAHEITLLSARYNEKSDRAGSIAIIAVSSVTRLTPATFFPRHRESARRSPRR
jgi:hypothetical protein